MKPASSRALDSSQSPPAMRSEGLEQLERILAHPLFLKSQRLSAFLRYAVEKTLAGEADSLKEFVIGAEALKRGDSFDPQTDNTVRVNANRLRGKLAEYYQLSGQSDPVVIDLPRGGYVPSFSSRPTVPQYHPAAFKPSAVVRTSVGRKHELDRIRTAFASMSGTTGLMVTIPGDAGMGKTTIVEDFLSELESSKTAVWIARGRCSERLAKTDAFVPILECLDGLRRGAAGLEVLEVMKREAPAWLAQIDPVTSDLVGNRASNASSERMRREFVRLFEALSIIRPVIVFLDDLHWVDASTCDLLAYLCSRMNDVRILIIATYRPSELFGTHPFLQVRLALELRGACLDIPLGFLTVGEIGCYLSQRFPANIFPPEFANVLHERTEGSPLFMKDTLRYLLDKGILVDRQGHWCLSQNLAEIRKAIPTGVRAMIRLKIDQLGELDRNILQYASVQGVEFDAAVISRALGADPGEVEDRLQALDRVHRFVRSVDERELLDRNLSTHYRFVHVLYQNALYADLTPTRRAVHSLAIARSISALVGNTRRDMAAEIALLFESGRDNERASKYFLRAARQAAGIFAYPEAVILCERGLRGLLSLPPARKRDSRELEFSLTLGMAQMATCGYAAPEVERTHRRSWELCLRLGERRRLVRVLWGVHTCLVNAGELVPALALSREMRQVAGTLADPASNIESLHALGTTLAFMGNLAEAREALEEIFALSAIGEHQFYCSLYVLNPYVTSLSMLARVLARMGFFDEAVERAGASVDLANQLAHPPSLAYATFWVGWICHARGDHSDSCAQLQSAMDLSRTNGLPQILEWSRVVRGSSLCHLGRVAEGISEMRRSLDNQLAMRCLLERPYCLTLLAEALLLEEGYEEALAMCDEALKMARETEGRSYEAETHRVRGKILHALNDAARRDRPSSDL